MIEILLIVGAIMLFQAAIWIPLVIILRKKSARSIEDLHGELLASGEPAVVGPEPALYRGGSRPYSKVKGNGTIVLTDRRLVFRKLTGGRLEIPRSDITGVRRSPGFQGSRVGGRTHLVVTTAQAEVGFFVQDLDAWATALAPENIGRDGPG